MRWGNLTPLGVLASEPTKILMVRTKISTVTSVASVTIENIFYTASVLVVLLSGTWLFLQHANVPPGLEQDFGDIVAGVAIAAVIGIWAARTRPAILSRFAPLVTKIAGTSRRAQGRHARSRKRRSTRFRSGRLAVSRTSRSGKLRFMPPRSRKSWSSWRLLVPDITLVGSVPPRKYPGWFVTVAFKSVPVPPRYRRSRLRRRRERPWLATRDRRHARPRAAHPHHRPQRDRSAASRQTPTVTGGHVR